MTGHAPDAVIELLAIPLSVMWLLLPANAIISIYRRRRNQPGASRRLQYAALILWAASLVVPVLLMFLGFGTLEGNPPPSLWLQVIPMLLVMIFFHIALIISGNAP